MGNEYQRFLMHHGIKGQKWGERNGPPYPLKPSQKSSAEKKAGGTEGSLLVPIAMVASAAALVVASSVIETTRSKRNTKSSDSIEVIDEAEKNSNDKRYASERENEEIDPETGLYLTGKKMSAEENMERINPSFDTGNEMFKVNCTCCTMAMELRERGYDVHAGTDGEDLWIHGGVYRREKESDWYSGKSPYEKKKGYDTYVDKAEAVKTLKDDMAKEPNSRGEISVNWLDGGAGHSMYYKTDNKGKMTIYDTQSNKKLTDSEANEMLNSTSYIVCTRLDQSMPNIQYLTKMNYIC